MGNFHTCLAFVRTKSGGVGLPIVRLPSKWKYVWKRDPLGEKRKADNISVKKVSFMTFPPISERK